ncbi:MAG: DUF4249 domain-containing protein [Bacteroidetes bacterium]|nr:DUF4249 domain-containing protein [Bacteroidota bacterium]
MLKQQVWLWGVAVLLISCEKAIDLNLDRVPPKLVVEATIENDQPPQVILTRSFQYFSAVNFSDLTNTFVRGAEVEISNGQRTHRLKEYRVEPFPGIYFFYYGIDSAQLSTAFLGALKTNYTLTIRSGGEVFTARTRIPDTTRRIDSIYWKPAPVVLNDPSKVALMLRGSDKPGLGDYIQYYTKQNRDPFYPGLNSVFDDQFIDGSSYEVQIERGVPRGIELEDGYSYFDRGDTVEFKLCNIDKATFDFWRTMEFSYASIGNPFSSPTRVLSNIQGNALGYFGGYAAQYRRLIIPR